MPAHVRNVIPRQRTVAWTDTNAKPWHGPATPPPAHQSDLLFQGPCGRSRQHASRLPWLLQLVSESPRREPSGEGQQFRALHLRSRQLQSSPFRGFPIGTRPRLLRAEQSFASSNVKRTWELFEDRAPG